MKNYYRRIRAMQCDRWQRESIAWEPEHFRAISKQSRPLLWPRAKNAHPRRQPTAHLHHTVNKQTGRWDRALSTCIYNLTRNTLWNIIQNRTHTASACIIHYAPFDCSVRITQSADRCSCTRADIYINPIYNNCKIMREISPLDSRNDIKDLEIRVILQCR
jgi:hypothetical protein